jgi:hypothetical protein
MPECSRRTNLSQTWVCDGSTFRLILSEFATEEAASQRIRKIVANRGSPLRPRPGLGEEAVSSEWSEKSASEWHAGGYISFRRGRLVASIEETVESSSRLKSKTDVDDVHRRLGAFAEIVDGALFASSDSE